VNKCCRGGSFDSTGHVILVGLHDGGSLVPPAFAGETLANNNRFDIFVKLTNQCKKKCRGQLFC
jgi:hypothetical protein